MAGGGWSAHARAAGAGLTLNDFAVLQRDSDNRAHVVLKDGETLELPTGSAYQVGSAREVLVGDLWVLAGQSNMEGIGNLVEVETPIPEVRSYGSSERWTIAEEPLHWLHESPRLVHHRLLGCESVPSQYPPRDSQRNKGAGLGLSFAKAHFNHNSVPVGLIPCAHGATSIAQWQPLLSDDTTLYAATIARIRDLGGRVAGILWFQGESDAMGTDWSSYATHLTTLLEAFRADLGQPDLPFLYVQIGRYVTKPTPELIAGWNAVREAQRCWVKKQHHAAMVSAIDLELDDLIHIGTQGLKRLGHRLALAAGGHGAPQPELVWLEGNRIHVRFQGIRGHLQADGRPNGLSLRDKNGHEYHCIHKVTLEDNTAMLHLTEEPFPPECLLWYGWGLNPHCNMTDTADMAVPAFGPISITQGIP